MLQSSAYRTKRWPRRSNSRSSSSSTRLLSSGESGPPCGVPSTLGLTSPFSITPAFRKARMSFNSRLSSTRSEPIAVLGKRRIPLPLQNLHHRLLDEAIQYGWDVGGIRHLMQFSVGDY